MKYLKLFQTTAQYNAYTADTANFITPNVSVCEDAPTVVHYNPQPTQPSLEDSFVISIGNPTTRKMEINDTITFINGFTIEDYLGKLAFDRKGEHLKLTNPAENIYIFAKGDIFIGVFNLNNNVLSMIDYADGDIPQGTVFYIDR